MMVNPFWFGVLMTLFAIILLLMIAAFIGAKRSDHNDQTEENEFLETLEQMTGRKFKVTVKNGYLVGEPLEDEDESEDN